MFRKPRKAAINVTVPNPCPQPWSEMVGAGTARTCAQCNHAVHDFTQLTQDQIHALVSQSSDRICARVQHDPQGNLVTLDSLRKKTSTTQVAAALIVSLAIGPVSAAFAQQPLVSIHGHVKDATGEAVKGSKLQLSHNGEIIFTIQADAFGTFDFEVGPGKYNLSASSLGFAIFHQDIDITDAKPRAEEIILQSAIIGSVIVVPGLGVNMEPTNPASTATIPETAVLDHPVFSEGTVGQVIPLLSSEIQGTVLDPSGVAIPNAKFALKENDRVIAEAVTDSSGKFLLHGWRGDYFCEISAPGFIAASYPIRISSKSVHLRPIKLSVGPFITGIIVTKTIDTRPWYQRMWGHLFGHTRTNSTIPPL